MDKLNKNNVLHVIWLVTSWMCYNINDVHCEYSTKNMAQTIINIGILYSHVRPIIQKKLHQFIKYINIAKCPNHMPSVQHNIHKIFVTKNNETLFMYIAQINSHRFMISINGTYNTTITYIVQYANIFRPVNMSALIKALDVIKPTNNSLSLIPKSNNKLSKYAFYVRYMYPEHILTHDIIHNVLMYFKSGNNITNHKSIKTLLRYFPIDKHDIKRFDNIECSVSNINYVNEIQKLKLDYIYEHDVYGDDIYMYNEELTKSIMFN